MSNWPHPPRRVRARTAFATWSPFGPAVAALLLVAVVGGVSEWSDDDFRSPRDDWSLDACEARGTTVASITDVRREQDRDGLPTSWALCTFRYEDAQGTPHTASSWLRADLLRAGDHRGVEYLPAEPQVARLVTGVVARTSSWLPWVTSWILLPLLFATGLWLSHVHRTGVVLRHGVATAARIVEVRCPEPARGTKRRRAQRCRVRFAYRGSDGRDHVAVQMPRLMSPLGELLSTAKAGDELERAFAVFAEWAPTRVRLVATVELTEDAPA